MGYNSKNSQYKFKNDDNLAMTLPRKNEEIPKSYPDWTA